MKPQAPPARENTDAQNAAYRHAEGAGSAFPGTEDRGGYSVENAQAHYKTGLIHQERGELEKAAAHLAAAARLAPTDHRYVFSLACVRQLQGCSAEAVRLYQRTLEIDPDCAQAHYNLGVIDMGTGCFESAIDHFEKTVALNPDLPQAHNNLGAACMTLGRARQAAESFEAAIRLNAHNVEAHFNLGRLFFSERRWEAAVFHFKIALELGADPRSTLTSIALGQHAGGDLDAAEVSYCRLLGSDPNDGEACLNLARLHLDRNDPTQGREWCRRAAAVSPPRADLLHRSGQILEQFGFFEEALAGMDRAVRLQPEDAELRFNRALLLLRMGRFADAWPDYEFRFKRSNWPQAYPHRIPKPRWDGSAFRGKTLLVHCEQGYGDTLQFARYLPLVKARGGLVFFEVQGPLVRLFRNLPGADEVLELSPEGITREPFDFYVPLLSLPGLFGTTLEEVPASLPFVAAEPVKVNGWKQRLGQETFNIGIVWAGSSWHHNDQRRSCRLSRFLPLAQIPGVRLVSLQKDKAQKDLSCLPNGAALLNAGPELHDFSATADLVAALDLVITVDTATAHLAAVMEKPVWVLVPFPADWRWLLERRESPWYPTLRLFRQQRGGGWEEVFRSVEAELRAWLDQRRERETLRSPGPDGLSRPFSPKSAGQEDSLNDR